MRLFLAITLCLIAMVGHAANPSTKSFRGTGGIGIMSNDVSGLIIVDGSGIFTTSGTNATIATSTNGVLVAVASTNINFITGSNVFLAATNIGSSTHIGINAFTPVPFIEGAVTNLLLTWILPILVVDQLTVSNLLAAPPLSSVQYNSNGITRGSEGFIYTNGQVRVTDVVIAGQGVEVTTGSFVLNGGTTALVAWNGLGRIRWDSDGVMKLENDAANNFNRINFRDNTAASPSLGITNGDFIIMGGNGNFKTGGSTNRLFVPAVHIANDGVMGTTLLRLERPIDALHWDFEINAHPDEFLGLGFNNGNYAMVWEYGGNVGIGITNPLFRLDVQGHTRLHSNVVFSWLTTNATPWNLLSVDSGGQVYETTFSTVSAYVASNWPGMVTNVVSLSITSAVSFPLTNSYANGVLTLPGIQAGSNVVIFANASNYVINAAVGSGGGGTNSLIQTNGVNVGSIGTLNWAAGITGSVSGAVVTLGASAGAGGFSVSGTSNQIPYLNVAGTGFTFGGTNKSNPGFGFSQIQNQGNGALAVHEDWDKVYSLVAIGPPNTSANIGSFIPSLAITNRYAHVGGDKIVQEMVRVTYVDVTDGSDPESFIQTWKKGEDNATPILVAGIRKDGQLTVANGTMYKTNGLTLAFPTAAQLGKGGYWVGVSNDVLVTVYSLNGTTTAIKVLAP